MERVSRVGWSRNVSNELHLPDAILAHKYDLIIGGALGVGLAGNVVSDVPQRWSSETIRNVGRTPREVHGDTSGSSGSSALEAR